MSNKTSALISTFLYYIKVGFWVPQCVCNKGVHAMKAISVAHFSSSIVALSEVFRDYHDEVEGDEVVSNHTKILYNQLL